MEPKVYIIILNWNQYAVTKECLDSLSELSYVNYQIIIVDNGSKDGSIEKLQKNYPNHLYVKNNENLGFAEGNNVGIKLALENKCDYILLLNNDTIVDSMFLSELIVFADKDPKIGAVCPKIYYYDKPKYLWFAGGIISKLTGRTAHIGINKVDIGQYDIPISVDFLTGCAFLVKRKVLDVVGLLDKDYFNNFEDVDWSIRMRNKGFLLFYVPAAKIWHKWSVSFGGRFSPFYTYYKVRNSLLYLKKNKMPFTNFLYAYSIFPVKMLFYTLMSFNLKNIKAVIIGVRDYFLGNYGKGKINV